MSYSRRVPEEEIIPRGREIYERDVRSRLVPEHEGKLVLETEHGHYEVSDDGEAFGRTEEKHPEAVFFAMRVGAEGASRPAYHIGTSLPGGRFLTSRRDDADTSSALARPCCPCGCLAGSATAQRWTPPWIPASPGLSACPPI